MASSEGKSTRAESSPVESAVEADAVAPDAKEKGLVHYLGVAVSGAVFVMVLAIAVLVIVLPAFVGGSALTVLTSSMSPKFPPGTLIIIKPTAIDEIRVGDVLTYQITSGQPAVISHRVITRSVTLEGETTFITKGDNNDLADPDPIMEVQVEGTLWYAIPGLGYINNLVNGDTRPWVTPIVAGLLFAYAGYTVISSIVGRRRKRAAVALDASPARSELAVPSTPSHVYDEK
ncbi:MAG: signal peptidase I [Salinibacterium sp.]|nr:signal peptidase I [Salinibacterium sp.]